MEVLQRRVALQREAVVGMTTRSAKDRWTMPRFEAPQRVGLPSVVQVRSTTGHWLTVQFGWLVLAVQCVASTASTAHRWGFEQKESEAKGAVRVVQLMFLARRPSREVFAGRLLCQQLQRRRLGEVWWPLPERFRRHTTSSQWNLD